MRGIGNLRRRLQSLDWNQHNLAWLKTVFQANFARYNWPHQHWCGQISLASKIRSNHCGSLNIALNKRQWKESIRRKRKQARVQFWKIVYCRWITIFFFKIFLSLLIGNTFKILPANIAISHHTHHAPQIRYSKRWNGKKSFLWCHRFGTLFMPQWKIFGFFFFISKFYSPNWQDIYMLVQFAGVDTE